MYTLTAMARNASLPRRTVQYWHDRGVIIPLSTDPVVYDNEELVLVRILAALTGAKPAIAAVLELSRVLRLAMAEDPSTPSTVAWAFAAARNGEDGSYLLIAAEETTAGGWFRTAGTVGDNKQLGAALTNMLRAWPNCGWTVVDLTFCFNTRLSAGPEHGDA